MIKRFQIWFRNIPERKRWIDVLVASLTVPVLLTVIISNILAIQARNSPKEPAASSVPTVTPQINIQLPNPSTIPNSPSSSPTYKSGVPDYEILSPQEGETISSNPVCVVLNPLENGQYLLKWSYRLNGSSWSPFSDQPICLYNMADGSVTLDIKIQNQADNEVKTYTRTFNYQRHFSSPTPTPTPTPSETPQM